MDKKGSQLWFPYFVFRAYDLTKRGVLVKKKFRVLLVSKRCKTSTRHLLRVCQESVETW